MSLPFHFSTAMHLEQTASTFHTTFLLLARCRSDLASQQVRLAQQRATLLQQRDQLEAQQRRIDRSGG